MNARAVSSLPLLGASEKDVVEHSREVLSHHARSFRWAALLLSRRCHDDAAVAYALCRHIDDTADEAPNHATALDGLQSIAAELADRAAQGPLVNAYLSMAKRTGIDGSAAQQLLAGARGDLCAVRIADDAELLRYCYRVAGTVGVMMCGVLGVTDRRALAHAVDLGVAMQLTNICRDVLEDAKRGRVYLPACRLHEVGVEPEQLVDGRAAIPAVAKVVADLLNLADRYYASADDGVHFIAWRARFAIVAASRIYRAIGLRLRRRNACNPMLGRVSVPPLAKLGWLLRAIVATVVLSNRRSWRTHDGELHAHLAGLLPSAAAIIES